MSSKSLFAERGAHVLVDGQYGSTGKGVLAAWLAQNAAVSGELFDLVISNGGPNSGHTFYHGDRKVVLKQLPTFAVASYLLGVKIPVFLSAGAVIDLDRLAYEASEYPGITIFVHPNAAVITDADRDAEHSGSIAAVAGTRSGTGAAIARKVMRDPEAVWGNARSWRKGMPDNVITAGVTMPSYLTKLFIEVSQGFSLGLNDPMFYPKVTSRECTVSQALADARLPPSIVTRTYMSIRTFPIRVGNVDGHSSGDWYPDQREVTWEELDQIPERTTVTNRIRRIATFSKQQFRDAMRANDPDFVFINFLNYLDQPERGELLSWLNNHDIGIIAGYGPNSSDVSF